MKRIDKTSVQYSFESGDKSLPLLKDLVSDNEDPYKEQIINYLRSGLILVSPGIIKDEINPERTIGSGYIYADDKYIWDDVFCNYVDRYNIPVPEEFRNHILSDSPWKEKGRILSTVDSIEIMNNPCLGLTFTVRIYKNGAIKYKISEKRVLTTIKPEDARWIMHLREMEDLFCYDEEESGQALIDGYHWKIDFYRGKVIVGEIEGWPGEEEWRYHELKDILEFAERYIPFDLGSVHMNYYGATED